MQRFGVERIGQIIVTPGMTANEMELVSNGISSLVRDVIDQDAPDAFRRELAAFAVEWNTFKGENSGWLARGSSGTYAQVQEYKERLNVWCENFKKLGKKVTSPKLKVHKSMVEEGAKGLVEAGTKSIKWVALGTASVGITALIIYMAKK